jgi:hypothetical protein
MTFTDRGTEDWLPAAIDVLLDRAAITLARHARRARMRLRESDPLVGLGLDVILSTLQEIIETQACEALERISAIRAGDWWLASGVRTPAGNTSLVVAASGRIISIRTDRCWYGQIDEVDRTANSLFGLVDGTVLEAIAIAAIDDETAQTGWTRAGSGRLVAVTTTGKLTELVSCALDGCGPYDPGENPRLSRALYAARRSAQQRTQAAGGLLDALRDDWVIATGVRLPGLAWPIGVLAIGPAGVFVCQPAGISEPSGASLAVTGARHLASLSRGMGAHIVPVVLCEPGTSPHQLQCGDGSHAWALPTDKAAASIEAAGRLGISRRRLRRVRRPLPGWCYWVARSPGGWTCEVRYELSSLERQSALQD